MPKYRKQKNQRVMSTTTTEIPILNEVQKGFEALLTADTALDDALAKITAEAEAAKEAKVSAFVKAVTPLPPAPTLTATAIAEQAKTACRNIEAAYETVKALDCMSKYLKGQEGQGGQIQKFEQQHCADALVVYQKHWAELKQNEELKVKLQEKIKKLEKLCEEEVQSCG